MQFIRSKTQSSSRLRIISLGGFGNVTTNMYVYELQPSGDILLIDCGIGFPSDEMPGVDLLIPDISYLNDKKDKIRGLVLTHGHDDHTGALAYILPRLQTPVYAASPLTAGFAELKLIEVGLTNRVIVSGMDKELNLGPFKVEFIRINHSTPDATHLFITTPVGNIYHGADYKFDFTPADGQKPDLARIAAMGTRGVKLLMSDCLGIENKGATTSEKTLNQMFERETSGWKGRMIITTLSSNISRFNQAIHASVKHGRKVALIGRSLERKVELASKLGYLKFDRNTFVTPQQSLKMADGAVTLLVSGSQGQPGSALDRIADGEHKFVTIKKNDKVLFSSPDYIPGTESAVHDLIDRLTLLGATVIYSDVAENLHVGGHGGQWDMKLLLSLTKPQFMVPTGGDVRHMKQYSLMAQDLGYEENSILLPHSGEFLEVTNEGVRIGGKVEVRNVMVDGLGVGDVGNVVLRDRQVLSEEGVVIVVAQIDQPSGNLIGELDVISRGFVYAKGNESLIARAREEATRAIKSRGKADLRDVKEAIVDRLERFLFDQTGRRPMILPVVVQV